MTSIQKDIATIINCAINNSKGTLSDEFDLAQAFDIAKRHGIITMVFYGLLNCGFSKKEPLMQEMFKFACRAAMVDECQKHEIARLSKTFEDNSIEHMFLKGTDIKPFYSRPEMRSMGDIDVLIKVSEYDKIKPIMIDLGYVEYRESDHEYVFKNQNLVIELHKCLIPDYNKDYYKYFGDGWRFAKSNGGFRYTMTDEDSMIYLFTHFAKHYRDSGIGLRHIIDVWVYRISHKNLDENYVRSELEKLKLKEFYDNIIRTLETWFLNTPTDDKTEFITQFIFDNGVYGTKHTHILAMALRDVRSKKSVSAVRIKKYLRSFFATYKGMCLIYPILEKWPVLLPVMWFVYFFQRLFTKGKISSYRNDVSLIKSEKIEKYRDELNFVGLDYNFEE